MNIPRQDLAPLVLGLFVVSFGHLYWTGDFEVMVIGYFFEFGVWSRISLLVMCSMLVCFCIDVALDWEQHKLKLRKQCNYNLRYPTLSISRATTDEEMLNIIYPMVREECIWYLQELELGHDAEECREFIDRHVLKKDGSSSMMLCAQHTLQAHTLLMHPRKLSSKEKSQAAILGWAIEFAQAWARIKQQQVLFLSQEEEDESETSTQDDDSELDTPTSDNNKKKDEPPNITSQNDNETNTTKSKHDEGSSTATSDNDDDESSNDDDDDDHHCTLETTLYEASMLHHFVFYIIKRHFAHEPYYEVLLQWFIDVMGHVDLSHGLELTLMLNYRHSGNLAPYNLETWQRLTLGKTQLLFYLPVVTAMVKCNDLFSKVAFQSTKTLCSMLAEYYQVQQDYTNFLDEVRGTDIQEGKCTWCIVQALERSNEATRTLLETNYGNKNEIMVQKVKQHYRQYIQMKRTYEYYEEMGYRAIQSELAKLEQMERSVFDVWIKDLYKR